MAGSRAWKPSSGGNPTDGLRAPGSFIPVMEQMGLITELGEWALRELASQVRVWRAAGNPVLPVSVNISPLHFARPSLLRIVEEVVGDDGISRDGLTLEITESDVQTQPEVIESFHQLHELGVKIAIDDFGTGYSSLGSLKSLPIDCLKIDRQFVNDGLDRPSDSVLLGTVIGMAHALEYSVVAEGVENESQVLALSGLGCDLAQGYFFAHPLPAEEIPDLLGIDFRRIPHQKLKVAGS